MRLFKPEVFLFKGKKEGEADFAEKSRPSSFKKFREPWKEEFNNGDNKVDIHYTGYQRDDLFHIQKLREAEITITNEQGKEFDFNSLLLKGWRFCSIVKNEQVLPSESSLFISHSSKEIWFPLSYFDLDSGKIIKTFSQPQALLGLLHEIGHSFEDKSVVVKKTIAKEKIREKLRAEMLKVAKMNIDISIKDIFNIFTKKEKQDYYQYAIIPERNAWAFALRQCQKLKKEGINIFPDKMSNQEILEIVRHNLSFSLDAGIGLMKDPLDDLKTTRIKRGAIEESRRRKSVQERFKDWAVKEILSKIMRI